MIEAPKDIIFTPEDHVYRDLEGRQLISVSQLIHHFVPEFDPDGEILKRCAVKKGVTPEELKKEWEKINKDSCDYGHNVHSELEYYIDHKQIRESPHKHIVEQFAKIKFKGLLQSETKIRSLKYRIAGTVDLIEFHDNDVISIYDFKTNKKLEKYSVFGTRMLYPFTHNFSTNFLHYTLQLNTYAFLLEEMGYWVKNLTIFYIHPKKQIIETHSVPFRRRDTEKLVGLAEDIANKL